MATVVIAHGGWGGGWEWTPVARLLRRRGHEVFTPTLTGMGERSHLGSDVRLSDHIEDLVAVLTFEALDDVVLCGHSYAGMVVTGVADRVADRVARLIYLDAFVPDHGQALTDLLPAAFAETLRSTAAARSDRSVPYLEDLWPPEGVIPEEKRRRYIARMRPQPRETMTEAIRLTGEVTRIPRAYVHCIAPELDVVGGFAARARAAGWPYREIATAHDLHLLDPEGTSAVIDDLVTTWRQPRTET